jgi:hypothetical protein
MKPLAIAFIGLISLAYLLNPTAGLFELIPDNIPLRGNLDEAAACALILAVLRYFGLDLTGFLRTTLDEEKPPKKDS